MADLKERFRSIYSDGINNAKLMHEILKPKQESFDEYADRKDAEDARKMFTGNGRQYGIQKGLEGFDTTLTVLGSAATPVAKGTKDVTEKLPQNNKQIWQNQINGEAAGEDELKNVAGGEGQKYNTTKASLNTKNVSASEGIRLKRAFNEMKEYFANDSFGLDKDVDLSEFEGKKVEVPADDAKEQANVTGAMFRTTAQKMEDAAKAGFETVSEHQKSGNKAYESKRYNTYEIPKDYGKEEAKKNADKWGSTINSGKSYEQRYKETFKKNHNIGKLNTIVEERYLPHVYTFMETLDSMSPELANNLRQAINMKDAKISVNENNTGKIKENAKTMVKEDLRGKTHQNVADALRNKGDETVGELIKKQKVLFKNQLESMPDKSFYEYASKILGKDIKLLKSLPKRKVAASLGTFIAQLMFSEEVENMFNSLDGKESPWTTDAQWQAKANEEQFNDWRGATASKYAPVFINDWLGKFNIDDVDDEDKETYRKLASIMRGYNSSRGSAIRSSDSTPKVILSDPTFVELFEKYNDPIMNKFRKR